MAGAMTEPRWAELAARVTMQHLTVGKAARIIEFHRQVQRVADPDELRQVLGPVDPAGGGVVRLQRQGLARADPGDRRDGAIEGVGQLVASQAGH